MVKRELFKKLGLTLLVLFLCFITAFCGQGNYLSASADSTDSVQANYESTNVLNNLKGSTIGGKEFDLADYPHNSKGKPQVISFVEFCYSYYAEKQSDYGLYVYVYNPQDVAFDMSTVRNKIQFTYGSIPSYTKYTLEFINYSTEAGYEGRFWKFKVKLTDEQRTSILRELDEANRIYKISGIELSIKNTVTEYPCGQTYTYKGYALGYGSELAQSDTLSCKVDGFDKYLSLDVRSTYYRPKGSNGSAHKQDTLHSVYFSVPDAIIDEYGEMTAVHATWLNAYTAPIFVTGNKDFYDNFVGLVGKKNPSTDYGFHTNSKGTYLGGFYFVNYSHGYNFSGTQNEISKLNYVFYADNGDADNYTLPAELLIGDSKTGKKGWFETYTAKFGGEKVIGKYSKALFEKYDDKFTDITITEEDTFKLTSVTSSQNLWQKIWGTSTSYTNTYNMRAIQKVTLDDIDNALSTSTFCDEYYVAETDYDELHDYVKKAKAKKETVYLFRYKQSEYFAVEQCQGKYKTGFHMQMVGDMNMPTYGRYFTDTNTNAYLCQMWVQLDYDIIDLTFTKDNVDTIIPVIMSPMDIVADGTPPLFTQKDGGLKWWQILLGIIALIFIVWLLLKFAPLIVFAAGKVVTTPFKAIGAVFKAGKKRRNDDGEWQKEKANRKIEKERKKVERLSNKISTRNHKKIVNGNKKIERDAKRVNVPVLKKKVLSGEISRWDLSRAETYALQQDAEYTEIMDMYDEAMSTSYDPSFDDDYDDWW